MHLMTRLSVTLGTVAVLVTSLASVGSASAHAALPVRALDACPATYTADFTAITPDFQTAASSAAADKLAAIALKLIQLRYKYEDSAPPAGCETAQLNSIKGLELLEDGAVLTLSAVLDSKNAQTYLDFVNKTWTPRLQAMGAAATPSAAPAPVATAAAAVCPDSAFTQQVAADFNSLNLSATETNSTVVAATALKVLKTRYGYEDMTAPAGCDAAVKYLAKLFMLATDTSVLFLAKLGDTTNAATYDTFYKKDLTDRATKIFADIGKYVDMNTLMSATAAPTAAK